MNEPSHVNRHSAVHDQAELEARYRRLLRFYPPAYRVEREDELVGVLLEAAPPSRSHPTAAEVLDLAKGGMAARWCSARGSAAAGAWQESSAIVCVLLPMLLALRLVPYALFIGRYARDLNDPAGMARGLGWSGLLGAPALESWATPLPWFVVTVAVFTRRPRLAAVASMAGVTAQSWTVVFWVHEGLEFRAEGAVPWLALGSLACVLLLSTQRTLAGRDWITATRLRVVAMAVAALALAAARVILGEGLHLRLQPRDFILVGLLAVVAARAVGLMADPVRRRLALAAFTVVVVVALGDQTHRVLNFRQTTGWDLIIEFMMCLMAPAVLVLGAAATSRLTALPRRQNAS